MEKSEIAVGSVDDAINAEAGGADSVEICRELSAGGLTPELELVRSIRGAVKVRVNVIVRPHARGFVYSETDVAEILTSAEELARAGVNGIVFGAWDIERRLNLELTQRVQSAAGNCPVTVHRALDESLEPERSLEKLAALGIARILTS